METTTTTTRRPRAAGPARASARADQGSREEQYDLLTATLIGVAIGAGVTLLLRTGPKGRPIGPVMRAAGRGAKWAGAMGLTAGGVGARYAGRGARWLADEAEDLWDRVPTEEIGERVGEMLSSARDRIDETVESELADLRKAIRRQRRKLGL